MKTAAKRLLLVLLVLACLIAAGLGWCAKTNKSILVGRYLRAGNGAHIIVDDRGSPVVMGNRSGQTSLFDDLTDGDRVLVLCGGINETYPGQSVAYWYLCLSGGTLEDIPADTLHQLTELGWLSVSA